MSKYIHYSEETPGDWTEEIYPNHDCYKLACCDCGLVHNVRFKVVRVTKNTKNGGFEGHFVSKRTARVMMQVQRNNRATGQMRRHMKDTKPSDKKVKWRILTEQ